jgi:hypothetical protein
LKIGELVRLILIDISSAPQRPLGVLLYILFLPLSVRGYFSPQRPLGVLLRISIFSLSASAGRGFLFLSPLSVRWVTYCAFIFSLPVSAGRGFLLYLIPIPGRPSSGVISGNYST